MRQNLVSTRPTAVQLSWALERMKINARNLTAKAKNDRERIKLVKEVLEAEANKILQEDFAACVKLSEFGSKLIPDQATVLTYCNTGSLATGGSGTALGVIKASHRQRKIKKVLVSETRPYLQGARLTAWELKKENIPYQLITDNMAAHLMKTEKIHAVIVGADRIAYNGDTANKIGTYNLAVLCQFHKIPFYVAAPTSTIDLKIETGLQIPIEERSQKEVLQIKNYNIAPEGTIARHPAFDVTPGQLITGIITEKGVISPTNRQNMQNLMGALEVKKHRD